MAIEPARRYPRPPRFPATIVVVALALAGCGGGGARLEPGADRSGAASTATPSPTGTPGTGFDYDASALDGMQLVPQATLDDGTQLFDASYPSPRGGDVTAWLVVPPGPGPFAALLYLHGSESNRDDLLDEAIAMAAGGAVSLVIDAPFARSGESRRGPLPDYFHPEAEAAMQAQTVVDLRRGIDLLEERPAVDPARIGFVGHSWGASTGAILGAVDPRVSALVLASGRPSWTEAAAAMAQEGGPLASLVTALGADGWQGYLDAMAPFDMVRWVGRIDSSRLLLQYGTQDDVVTADDLAETVAAAPAGAEQLTYPAGHDLDAQATADRAGWLAQRLGMTPIPAAALEAVGLPDAPTRVPGR